MQSAYEVLHLVNIALLVCDNFFSHFLINGTIFGRLLLTKNICFVFLYNLCVKYFSFKEEFRDIL